MAFEPPTPDVASTLRWSQSQGLERLDAQLLLGHALGRERVWLLAHGEAPVPSPARQRHAELVRQRAQGVPLAYLVGHHEFYGLDLHVTPDVLDPRADTEVLVEWALSLLPEKAPARVVDLGTGSGAIALAIAQHRPQAQVWGVDLSAQALAVARANGQRLGLPVQWLLGSWCAPLGTMLVDVLLSNPPYLAEDDPHLPDLCHEPRGALVAPEQGLSDLRCIIEGAGAQLNAGGWLLLEHGHTQAQAVAAMLAANQFQQVQSRHDLAGHARCTGGQWQPLAASP